MMNWANARNTICHHSRNAGNMPARAMIAPSKVAGTAAIAQVATPPYHVDEIGLRQQHHRRYEYEAGDSFAPTAGD